MYRSTIEIMMNSRKMFLDLCTFFLLFTLVFAPFNLKVFANSGKENDQLIERISKDFTKKFCNGIAFGLSKESAMNFANKENNLIFKKKKGFDSLKKELIASNIAISVVEKCGYPINLKGQKSIEEFQDNYLSMNNSILNMN